MTQTPQYDKLASGSPQISVVTDHPLGVSEFERDSFDLISRLGSVFDIIRHPETKTPISIAIYGDWGTGKSSAMAWLQGLLERSNEYHKPGPGGGLDRVLVRPVWFYPWKYQTKEDVWRGLIAEVIVNGIEVQHATPATVTNAVKQFGLFLGRSFIHTMAAISLKAKTPDGSGEAEFKLDVIKQILDDYRGTAHPEKAYLNDFESSLAEWVSGTLGEQERMVVFIDDLDRCMPDIALHVLEALKLYLNIPKLVFVLGLDRTVIAELVREHYSRLGVHDDKSRHYLAKMFQIEVEVPPHELQIEHFFNAQANSVSLWKTELAPRDQAIFRDVMLNLAGANPREVKRLINSALMAAAGFLMNAATDETRQDGVAFNQALQAFLVRKILQDRHGKPSLILQQLGDDFFSDWSHIVKRRRGGPQSVQLPDWFLARQMKKAGLPVHDDVLLEKDDAETVGSDPFPAPFRDLCENQKYAGLLHLLGDKDLGKLMAIEYSRHTSFVAGRMGRSADNDTIRAAIARELGVRVEALTRGDYSRVTRLNLADSDITALDMVADLATLEELNIAGTQVADLEPVRCLSSLKTLYIGGTRITRLDPLSDILGLSSLSAVRLDLSSLGPLSDLQDLEALFLQETGIVRIDPLSDLRRLMKLNISGSQVADIGALSNHTALRELGVARTQVSSLEALKTTPKLVFLDVSHTPVEDLTPLTGLSQLEILDISGLKGISLDLIASLMALKRLRLLTSQYTDALKRLGELRPDIFIQNTG